MAMGSGLVMRKLSSDGVIRSRFSAAAKKVKTSLRGSGKTISVARTWGLAGMAVYDKVHDPTGAGGALAGTGALAPAQQRIDDSPY